MKKYSGICIDIDSVGRLVIPKEIREKLGLISKTKNTVECSIVNNTLVIKRYDPSCVFCGGTKKVQVYKDRFICESCTKELINDFKDEFDKDQKE